MCIRDRDIADKVAQVSSKKICDIMKIEQVNVIEEGSLSEEPAVDTVQKLSLIHIYAVIEGTGIDVIISGTGTILENISATDITCNVNAAGLSAGTHSCLLYTSRRRCRQDE